jgi:hypothetical protein
MKDRLQSLEVDYSSERSTSVRLAGPVVLVKVLIIVSKSSQGRGLVAMPRHNADFTCYAERGGTNYEPQYILHCAKVHCKHKYIR